jgi:superfamily I DNA and/or RNA helicase
MEQLEMNQEQTNELLLLSIVSGISNGIFVEMGTNSEHFIETILSINSTNTIYLSEHDEIYSLLRAKYKNRVLTVMPDTFDFLHIDCNNQTYEEVKYSLDKYFPQVINNGIVMGSDVKDNVTKAFSDFI